MSDGSGRWGRDHDQDPVLPTGPGDGPSSPSTPTRPGSHIIRPMPTGEGAGSFEDLARRSVLSRAQDDSRFVAPETADVTRGGRAISTRALLTLAVAMLVLGIAAGVLWVNVFRTEKGDDETIVKPSAGSTAKQYSPQEAVLGYLEALSEGRVEDALALGAGPQEGESEVLLEQSSYDAMPVASRPNDIRILTQDPLATEIRVEYTLSGEKVSTTMRVVRGENDSYSLERTTVTIQLQVVGSESLPVQLNGITIDPQLPLAVLPGTYRPSTELAMIAFLDAEPISIPSTAYADTVDFLINPELTPEGSAGFEQAARDSLDRCMASRELAPAGCPNEITGARPVVPGSIRWELLKQGEVWGSFKPSLSTLDQTRATATLSMVARATMDYTDATTSGQNDIVLNVTVSASMLSDDPSSISVVWGR